jgi:glycerate 2-kinase
MSEPPVVADLHAQHREWLRGTFQHALAECSIERAFQRHVGYEGGVLRVEDDLYALADYDRVFVVAIGKAAHTMVEALAGRTGAGLHGIVTGPTDPERMTPGLEYFRGGHPFPNRDSVKAGEAILRGLRLLTERSLAIFLLSGGGSALVEKPIHDISFDDLTATYRALVLSGAPIAQINAVR